MITENLSTLKIHKLTQEQYQRELDAGRIDGNALYLTPHEEPDLSHYATVEKLNDKADENHEHEMSDITNLQVVLDEMSESISEKADASHNHDSAYETNGAVFTHDISTSAHNDIRNLITGLTTRLNTLANSDDTTLDQMSEVVAYIKNNKSLIDGITTSKVNVADIVNNLTTNVANKPLSAAQGAAIKTQIDGKANTLHIHPYGVCNSGDFTKAKTVTVENFSLVEGARVIVKFNLANNASSPTLNVNGTGAKPIIKYGTTAAGTADHTNGWEAGAIVPFTYDGTNWVQDYWYNTTYSNVDLGQGLGYCYTTSGTDLTAGLYNYNDSEGGIVSINFTYDVPAAATLNINSQGAREIYYKDEAIEDGLIEGGDTATFIYANLRYHLISIDRWHDDIVSLQDGLSKKAGEKVTGKSLLLPDGSYATAEVGAEIFNDYTNNAATGKYSHAEGTSTTATGKASHAEGEHTDATAYGSHAEGVSTTASGQYSHAEGNWSEATGLSSHAEGTYTVASGKQSHAEGQNSKATGLNSHAEGRYTLAAGENQHTQGRYNIEDTANKYAHIVGNGDSNTYRSNAHTLDWSGNAWFAGNIYVGGTCMEDAVPLKSVQEITIYSTEELESTVDNLKDEGVYRIIIDTSDENWDGDPLEYIGGDVCLGGYELGLPILVDVKNSSYRSGNTYDYYYTNQTLYCGDSILFRTGGIHSYTYDDPYRWDEWRFFNPPMELGVEYCTMENHNGQPVYAKRISYKPSGTVGSASGHASVSIAHDISNFNYLVRASGTIDGLYPMPHITSGGGSTSIGQVTNSAIVLYFYKNTSTSAHEITLYYTKKQI